MNNLNIVIISGSRQIIANVSNLVYEKRDRRFALDIDGIRSKETIPLLPHSPLQPTTNVSHNLPRWVAPISEGVKCFR